MIKVVLTGSESTGKTELARRLAGHFQAPCAAEFVREFAARKPGPIVLEDHDAIAAGQMANEDAAIARAADLVILDTDLVSTVVYCEHYFGSCPAWIETKARARLANLYLLLQPDIPWKPDGVRDRGDRRDEMHDLFAAKLRQLGASCVEIAGTGDDRLQRAAEAIAALRMRVDVNP